MESMVSDSTRKDGKIGRKWETKWEKRIRNKWRSSVFAVIRGVSSILRAKLREKPVRENQGEGKHDMEEAGNKKKKNLL